MGFGQAISLSAVQAGVRLALGLLTIKLTASHFGPEGVGLMAQLGTFVSLVGGLLANGGATAWVRLYPENRQNATMLQQLVGGLKLIVLTSAVGIALALPFSASIASFLLGSQKQFLLAALTLLVIPAFVAGAFLQAWLTSQHQVRAIYLGQTAVNVLASALLVLVILATNDLQTTLAVSVLAYALPAIWFWIGNRKALPVQRIREGTAIEAILHYYPMLVVHAVALPGTLLLVRWYVAQRQGLEWMGSWQAGWRLSDIYLAIVMSAIATYFGPRMAEQARNPAALRRLCLVAVMSTTLPVAAAGLIIWLGSGWIIPLIFSKSFGLTIDLLPVQVTTDVLRAAHWSIGLALMSIPAKKTYIALELGFVACCFAFVWALTGRTSNLAGWPILLAYLITACAGSICLAFRLRRT